MTQGASVFLLAGSVRKTSYTHALVAAIAERLAVAEGVRTEVWDLRKRPLPIADPAYHHNPADHPNDDVRAFAGMIASAHAIVLATPVYHNGISGVIKNALDHATIEHFYLKPVGLASHGEGRTTQAVEQLRIIVRGLLGYAIATQVCTAEEDYTLSQEAEGVTLTAAPLVDRVARFCRELVVMSQLMGYAQKLLG
jgi:NAD(P)H-dependent FMN reductase